MSTRRAIFHKRRIFRVTFTVGLHKFTPELYFPVAGQFVRFWASGGAKFLTMGDSLPRTPMNHREKFDAASFILGRKIRNCTNKQKTNKQTVNDISI